ncbi:hypothetical protein BaRGS_00002660 [Batillaria attramentaria]|uniref:Tyrosine specific protein phosphatases domain-containing protein n=1 Tax=Batillaria attramentaria TaxID=370345 RepID=A0ABD0M3U6_9CAEN
MVTVGGKYLWRLSSVPNFRVLCASGPHIETQNGLVYRSSRPDFMEHDELGAFKELGIQSIIDFRSRREYLGADGNHLIDQEYHLYQVKLPHGRNFRSREPVSLVKLKPKRLQCPENADSTCKHFLINFFPMSYIWNVFNRAPWYIRLYSLIFLLFDIIFQTGYKYFVRLFARTTLNHTGLIGQYQDMVELSQRGICAALKLLCNKDNLPALLNCAHGKDRTGIVSALILSLMGKSPEYIAEEYALSSEGLAPIQSRLHSEVVERFHMSEEFITAQADTMRQLFQFIRDKYEYGSVENYLEYIGFGASEQETLRHNLMEADRGDATENRRPDGEVAHGHSRLD